MTPDQQATRRGLLQALHKAERAVMSGPREPRETQEQLQEMQRSQAQRDRARLVLDAFDAVLGLPPEDPGDLMRGGAATLTPAEAQAMQDAAGAAA